MIMSTSNCNQVNYTIINKSNTTVPYLIYQSSKQSYKKQFFIYYIIMMPTHQALKRCQIGAGNLFQWSKFKKKNWPINGVNLFALSYQRQISSIEKKRQLLLMSHH